MRTLNVRLAVSLVVGSIVFGGIVHAAHYFQVHRNASAFLREADRAEKRADLAKEEGERVKERDNRRLEIQNLSWYVEMAPNSPDAADVLEKLGFLLADISPDPRSAAAAAPKFEELLRKDPDRPEARRRLAEIEMSMGRHLDAEDHIRYLLKTSPKDASLMTLLGRCQAALGHFDESVESFKEAIKLEPDQLEAYAQMAPILRQKLDRPIEADEWMETLVKTMKKLAADKGDPAKVDLKSAKAKKALAKANSDLAKAYIWYGRYLLLCAASEMSRQAENKARKDDEKALQADEMALVLAPDDQEGLYWAAQCAMSLKQLDKARDYAKRGVRLYKTNAHMHLTLSDIEWRAGNHKKAVADLQEGLQATNHHPEILWRMANLHLDERDFFQAEKVIQELRLVRFPSVLLRYLDARIEFCKGHWLTAREAMEKVRPDLTESPQLSPQQAQQLRKMVDYWIGLCYGLSGNTDKQLDAYRRAVAIDPLFTPAHAGIAEILLASGQINSAIDEYQQVVRSEGASTAEWSQLARMLIFKNLHQSPAERNWGEVDKVLDRLDKLAPNLAGPAILRAEIMVQQGNADLAERYLEDLHEKNPDKVEFWTILASFAQRREQWDKVEELLHDAKQRLGDSVALRLAYAQYLVKRYGNDAGPRLKKLTENLDKLSAHDRIQLFDGLIIPCLQANNDSLGRLLCMKVLQKEPDNLRIQFLRFELALRAQDSSSLPPILADIEKYAGRNSMWLYGQAVYLSLQSSGSGQAAALNQAMECLTQAREQRPTWSKPPALVGGIYDKLGNRDQALLNYQEAIRLGDRNPQVVQRAVELLYQKHKFAEADRLLRQFDERQMPMTHEIDILRIEVDVQLGNDEKALENLLKSKTKDSQKWQEQLWRGQVLASLGRRALRDGRAQQAKTRLEEATNAFRRAIELSPTTPETWITFVQFYTGVDQAEKAREVLDEARRKLSPKQVSLTLAQCYDVLDDSEAALKNYKEALAAAPDDAGIIRRVADFYLRHDHWDDAEPLLKQLVSGKGKSSEDDLIWTRRNLALSSWHRGGYANLQAALKIIEQNVASGKATPQDRRAKAIFLAYDPDSTRKREAINTLESLIPQEDVVAPEDKFTLANLYMAETEEGDWARCRELLRSLSSRKNADPRHVAAYIAALMKHHELSDAELILGVLERSYPDDLAPVNLRAELLIRRNQDDQAIKALKAVVAGSNLPADKLPDLQRVVAGSLEHLSNLATDNHRAAAAEKLLKEAEALYRVYAGKRPGGELMLAGFLARHGKVKEAMDLINDQWAASDPTAVAQALSTVVSSSKATAKQLRQAEAILQDALKKFNRPTLLLLIMADLYASEQRYDEAERCYREILARDPKEIRSLNNLAGLLAIRQVKVDEALQLVNRALEICGPITAMLDTRAMVYLAAGKPEKALDDLGAALANGPTPVHLFHQAQAYDQAGKKSQAATAFTSAEKLGLKPEMLAPAERPLYRKLRDDLRNY